MEVHQQTCQLCQSIEMNNILVREPGEPDKIFARCAKCGELVARYSLAHGGYYHHHKGYESYLRGIARTGEAMSGKRFKQEYEATQTECLQRFDEVLIRLKEHLEGKD